MSWGLSPGNRGSAAVVWWGARAIYDSRSCDIDLLWDRMAWNGLGEGKEPPKDLAQWIDKKGLPKLRKLVKKHCVDGNEDFNLVVQSDEFALVANPRKSCGYLYIGAWKRAPNEDLTKEDGHATGLTAIDHA